MNCHWCGALVRYLVTGRRRTYRVCGECLWRAQREAGVPRSTASIDLGLLNPDDTP